MPNDNQAAKSYIDAVMARADGATKGPWSHGNGAVWPAGETGNSLREVCDFVEPKDAVFIAASRQDIPTLAKMLLRAIAGLNEMRIRNSWAANVHADDLLAEINDMAKGSQ